MTLLSTPKDTYSNRIRTQAAWVSALASIFIFIIKVVAYKMTGSSAILSDALEGIVNVIAAVVTLFVVRIAARPADLDHPYGHGKAENFSSAFEGGMIFFAAVMIIGESLRSLFFPQPPQRLELGLGLVLAAAILNLFLGFYLKRVGDKSQSEALRASGAHVLSDVITTAGVIVGLGLVLLTGLTWLDPVIAILVGLQLAYSGYKIVRESLGVLMDEQDEKVLESLAQSLEKHRRPGIIDVHKLRTIRAGRFHHIDAHLVVPEFWNISVVHEVAGDFERDVVQAYKFDGELAFHIDPCKKSFCVSCALSDCPIRQRPLQEQHPFTVKSLTAGPRPTNSELYDDDSSSRSTTDKYHK